MLAEAKKRNVKFLLPVDHVVAMKPEANAVIQQVGEGQPIPADKMALDIGPKTIELFSEEISTARTIVWNGPMGVFEVPGFSRGTFKIAHAVADNGGATSIVGGGDSVAAVTCRQRRRQDHSHLHRRRCVAGISGRERSCQEWKRLTDKKGA